MSQKLLLLLLLLRLLLRSPMIYLAVLHLGDVLVAQRLIVLHQVSFLKRSMLKVGIPRTAHFKIFLLLGSNNSFSSFRKKLGECPMCTIM